MKRAVYLLGFISSFLISTAFLFKMMHWAGASVVLVTGIVFLNFGFLPVYFYDKYKTAV